MKNYSSDLDICLLEFKTETGNAKWSLRDAANGLMIFGGIGSGKSSGSGKTMALKYLAHGFGGLVLAAKEEEVDMWKEYCKITNRTKDLVVIEPGGNYFFNFLEYESSQKGEDASITANIVDVLKTVIKASEELSGGNSNDPFWEKALDMLIFNVLDLCNLAFGKATIERMYDIVLTAPKKPEGNDKVDDEEETAFSKAFTIAQNKVLSQIDAWEKSYFNIDLDEFREAENYQKLMFDAIPDARIFKMVDQFFIETLRNLNEKTRSIIEFSFLGFMFYLLKDPIYTLFCNKPSNIVPEDCLMGKIILLNLPVKKYHKVGRDSQIMFKYIWQRALERKRGVGNDRPVFLWSDEAQHFLHEHDTEYQATARSSLILTVYISQNLPNFYASMGGEQAQYKVKGFIGTMGTKIFHSNADIDTNLYASKLVGQDFVEVMSKTVTTSKEVSLTESTTHQLEDMLRPEQFVNLKTGGPMNANFVECIMHCQGNSITSRNNFIKLKFNQKFFPQSLFINK